MEEEKKKTYNIENIILLTPEEINKKYYPNNNKPIPSHSDGKPLVVVDFKFPCKFTTLSIDELLEILRLWIIAEEIRYIPRGACSGRWKLFTEIKKVFEDAK